MSDLKVLIHIETQISSACSLSSSEVTSLVSEHLKNNIPLFRNGYIDFSDDIYLSSQVDFIIVTDLKPADAAVSFWQAELAIHAYRLLDSEPEKDYLEGEEDLPACEQWELPNKHLSGLWESIIVEETIKDRLLGYCDTSIAFAEAGVDSNVISWNRMALLYGPPGTGKTTICKALAQKMYIRHCSRYSAGMLLEINSHSLFSKWFSESGKLVMKLFEHIHEIAEDPQCFVTVLIDEVESIVMARNSTARSNEPGDAVRVVNSVLTSLDSLRRKPNVLVLCTSNLVSGIDAAFQDRVDLQVYLGPPLLTARYAILHSCVMELMHRGLIKPAREISADAMFASHSYQTKVDGGYGVDCVEIHERPRLVPAENPMQVQPQSAAENGANGDAGKANGHCANGFGMDRVPPPVDRGSVDGRPSTSSRGSAVGPYQERAASINYTYNSDAIREVQLTAEELLFLVASLSEGFSGRALRKLPLRAHAFYIQRPSADAMEFLWAMQSCLEESAIKRSQGMGV